MPRKGRTDVSADAVARICKVLSVSTRVRIVQLLTGRAMCVGALSRRLDVTQGAVSQHLRVLRDAGLVAGEKRGYFVHYRLRPQVLAKCKAALDRLLEQEPTQCPERKADSSSERKRSCAKMRRPKPSARSPKS